jgi:hypothetical protein
MNNRLRASIYNFAGILVLLSATLQFFKWSYAPYIFALGSAGVAISHLTAPYKTLGFRQKRLQRFNIIASILMIFSSTLMFRGDNEWVLCLFIAAILQLYTAFVTPKE